LLLVKLVSWNQMPCVLFAKYSLDHYFLRVSVARFTGFSGATAAVCLRSARSIQRSADVKAGSALLRFSS